VKVVQKLLGHKTAVLTLDRYGHLFPDDLDAVATARDSAADDLRAIGAPRVTQSEAKSLWPGWQVQGGRCRIRTCVGVSRRIYSPLPLAARATCLGAALRPTGLVRIAGYNEDAPQIQTEPTTLA
jgi:hypothetical protein